MMEILPTITKYKLYRSETAGFGIADAGVDTTEITDAALRELEVPGLAAASTEYYFKLTAFNSIGEGSPTDEFSAFTPTDGLVFTLINSDTEYSVTSGTVINTAAAIAVPADYEGKKVTTLGANAFDGFSQMVSIRLPEGVTTIRKEAFHVCTSLALTSLPHGVTTIGDYAFISCRSLAISSLPDGVTTIGIFAFAHCTKLTEISINRSTPPTAGLLIFDDCTNLTKIKVPTANVQEITRLPAGGMPMRQ